jgi:hypothetical protein
MKSRIVSLPGGAHALIAINLLALFFFTSCGSKPETSQPPAPSNDILDESNAFKGARDSADFTVATPEDVEEPMPQKKGWKKLTKDNVSIVYPDTWKSGPASGECHFRVYLPAEAAADGFSENLIGNREELPEGTGLDEFVSANMESMQILSKLRFVENVKLKNKSGNYRKLVYTYDMGMPFKMMQCYWVKDGFAYLVSFTSQPAVYDQYEEEVSKAMDSFNIE